MPRWLSKNSVLTSDFPETAVPQTAEPATDQRPLDNLQAVEINVDRGSSAASRTSNKSLTPTPDRIDPHILRAYCRALVCEFELHSAGRNAPCT